MKRKEYDSVGKKSYNQESTFVLKVRGEKNKTWQGTIRWIEENKERHFGSALELLKLMDEVLAESGDTNDGETVG